jgi:uncharacterized membrane protein YedE/YeeE
METVAGGSSGGLTIRIVYVVSVQGRGSNILGQPLLLPWVETDRWIPSGDGLIAGAVASLAVRYAKSMRWILHLLRRTAAALD